MALPTQPTATLISTEAWKLFGKRSPTTAEITRATDYGIESVKADMMQLGTEWDFLRTVNYQPCVTGQSKYQAPTDFRALLKMSILDGARRGTAQTGTSSTITLAAADSGSQGGTEGKYVVLTGGTGATAASGEARQIKSYDSTTKIATVSEDWTTTPDSTSTYLIVDNEYELKSHPIDVWHKVQEQHLSGRANNVFHQADDAEGDFILDRVPDKIYVMKQRYYTDLLQMDLAGNRYSFFLRLAQWVLIQGVFVWTLQDDARQPFERARYKEMLLLFASKHLYPHNLNNMQATLDLD